MLIDGINKSLTSKCQKFNKYIISLASAECLNTSSFALVISVGQNDLPFTWATSTAGIKSTIPKTIVQKPLRAHSTFNVITYLASLIAQWSMYNTYPLWRWYLFWYNVINHVILCRVKDLVCYHQTYLLCH